MKNIYLILSLTLILLPSVAQAQCIEELEHKTISVSQQGAEQLTPDTQWYLVYNHLSQETSEYQGGGYLWDRGLENELYLSEGPDVVRSGMLAKDAAQYMVRFISAETTSGDLHEKYYFQFGTGNYVAWPATGNDGLYIYTFESMTDACPAYVYLALDTPCYFCFSTTDGNYRVDTYGTGNRVILSGQGEKDDLSYLDDVWFLFPISLSSISERDEAMLQLEDVLRQYAGYRNELPTGTEPGYYDADAVAAFEAALDAAAVIDDPDVADSLTAEDLLKLAQNIVDAYEAAIASLIPSQMAFDDGYYYLVSGGESFSDGLTKGMYSEMNSSGTIQGRWATLEESCPFLWRLTENGNREYRVENMATNATFDNVATSTNVTLSKESTNLMVFDYGPKSDEGYYYIRISTQAEGSSYYLHCSGWTGTGNTLVGWYNTLDGGASSWMPIRVSDEEAEAIIEDYNTSLDAKAMAIIEDAKAKMEIAEDNFGLISSVNQLSSPYTASYDGQGLPALIDGDIDTFWHSDWAGGDVPAGTHYLQVELAEEYDELYFTFSRRNQGTTDHITQWGVYGAPSLDADKSQCTWLSEEYTPYTRAGETLSSEPFTTTGYTILRFYIDDTTGFADNVCRGYGHISEFQLYNALGNAHSQMSALGDIYTNLQDAIAAAQAEMSYTLTEDTYNALVEAYDAFIDAFVDPTELRTAISEAQSAVSGISIGTNPGQWNDYSTADAIATTIANANEYDKSGYYTQAESDTYVLTLTDQLQAFCDAAVKVQTDRWYQLRYATEEEIEDNGWDASLGRPNNSGEGLYGKYIAVASLVEDDGYYVVEPLATGDLATLCIGQNLYFQSKLDIAYEDYAKFRFVSVGDTAFMMQNKATGLFLKATGESGAVTLSPHPTLFNVSAIGYGENLIAGKTLRGDPQSNLHAQLVQNILVTWPDSVPGSNSGLYIEDIDETVASDYDGTQFNIAIVPGSVNTFCFPVSLTSQEGTFYGAEVEGTTVTLHPIEGNSAEPGQPFVYILGDPDSYDAEDAEEPVAFTHGYEVEKEAQISGDLIGSYYSEVIGSRRLVASDNAFRVTSSSAATVTANGAYIDGDYNISDAIAIVISEDPFTGITDTLATVAQSGNVYSIDGKLVTHGNFSSIKSLPRGIYILNGVKIAVK